MKDYMSVELTPELQVALDKLLVHHSEFNHYKQMITRAFKFAVCAHEGVKRKTGEDYVMHPIRVANIMDELKADYETICAALLHDTVEDVDWVTSGVIANEFGPSVARLVDGVTKASIKGATKEEEVIQTIIRIFFAFIEDPRSILIKFGDRLDNMGSIKGHSNPQKRISIAEQTLDIYVPLAKMMSVYSIKEKLEEMSFKVIQEDKGLKDLEYLRNERQKLFEDNEKIMAFIGKVTQTDLIPRLLKAYDPNIKLVSSNTRKNVDFKFKTYSQIYEKMKNLHLDNMKQIHDIINISINTNTVEDCYSAMKAIQSYKREGEDTEFFGKPFYFKDYISKEAFNGYQAIHARYYVASLDQVVQFEFRTHQMRNKAVNGIASCWNYDYTDPVYDMKQYLYKLPFYEDLSELCQKYTNATKDNKSKNQVVQAKIDRQFYESLFRIINKRIRVTIDNTILDDIDSPTEDEINTPRIITHQIQNGLTLGELLRKKIPEFLGDGSIFQIDGAAVPLHYKLKDGDIIKRVKYTRKKDPQRTLKK